MNSFKIKALAVAVLGLAGIGSAVAACPTAVTTKGTTTPGGGGAWTSQFIATDATLDILTPGLNGTNCALGVSIGASSSSRAFVQDSSPQNEQRYRARFYISLANLVTQGFGQSNRTAIIFNVNDTTGPAQFTSDELGIRIVGGSTPSFRFFLSDSNPVSGLTQVIAPLPASATNTYRIEFDLQHGSGTTTTGGCTDHASDGWLLPLLGDRRR